MPKLRILPRNLELTVPAGGKLLDALREAGIYPDAPCGGNGTCGKCRVLVDGETVLACRTVTDRDMTVTLPEDGPLRILQDAPSAVDGRAAGGGYLAAVDIGTTSVVCFLLDGETGAELARSSMRNPQTAFGADVVTRIRAALEGAMARQTALIREGVAGLLRQACGDAGIDPGEIKVVSLVGNPAMQQLFLGISPENLAGVPFAPKLTRAERIPCKDILPVGPGAQLLIVPDISGYIGADTMGCVLATGLHRRQELTLLVDIGTNGEMVLGNQERMVACSAAAGPALEGANIRCGMRAEPGAIDHVWLEDDEVKCSVIGGGTARGICGSGLVDAIAVGLETGLLNKRGRIQNPAHSFCLTDTVCLTQDDIRQVQLAKGAIRAGIGLMAGHLGVAVGEIRKVLLAGAFGTYMDPASACRIGLLPEELADRIEAVGNAAGSGAKLLARDESLLPLTQELTEKIEFLELASLAEFAKTFAKAMNFREEHR